MRLTIILALLLATAALAGEHNPGPGEDEVVEFWDEDDLTTTGLFSQDEPLWYNVGLDTGVTVNVSIAGAEEGDTVTVSATWRMPNGEIREELEPQVITWTQGERTDFMDTWAVPRGADRLYLSAITTDTNGCTITASVIGAVNGTGPVSTVSEFSGDVEDTTQGYLSNLGYDELLFDKDDPDTGISNPSANVIGFENGGTENMLLTASGDLALRGNIYDYANPTNQIGLDAGVIDFIVAGSNVLSMNATSLVLPAANQVVTNNVYGATDGDTGLDWDGADGIDVFLNGTKYIDLGPNTGDVFTLNAGALSSTRQAMDISGTLPNTAAIQDLVALTATPAAGGNATLLRTLIANLEAGYTGTARTTAIHGRNVTAGTGTSWYDGNGANYGFYSNAAASTAGSNVGLHSYAASSTDINIGVSGFAITSTGGKNVGIVGIGRNLGAGLELGGYFGLDGSDPDGSFVSAALQLNNGDRARPILVMQDNGVTKGQMLDGGVLQLEEDLYFDGSATRLGKSGSDLLLTDAVAGSRTLEYLLLKTQLAGSSEQVQDTVNISVSGQIEATQSGDTTTISGTSGIIVQRVRQEFDAVDSTSTQIPADYTRPQNTEGKEIWTRAFLPRGIGNRLRIRVGALLSPSAATHGSIAVFRNDEADAFTANTTYIGDAQTLEPLITEGSMIVQQAGEITFKVRMGPATATTLYVNGDAFGGGNIFNGAPKSWIEIEEELYP